MQPLTQLINIDPHIDKLFSKISTHIENAKNQIQRSIDTEMVKAYWLIGRDIVEDEQSGQRRAEYGKAILDGLSQKLFLKHGKGFSVHNLKKMRQFYLEFKDMPPIGYALRIQSKKTLNPNLGWTHYRALMRVDRLEARSFYEIETLKNGWTGRELERQINSLLFLCCVANYVVFNPTSILSQHFP